MIAGPACATGRLTIGGAATGTESCDRGAATELRGPDRGCWLPAASAASACPRRRLAEGSGGPVSGGLGLPHSSLTLAATQAGFVPPTPSPGALPANPAATSGPCGGMSPPINQMLASVEAHRSPTGPDSPDRPELSESSAEELDQSSEVDQGSAAASPLSPVAAGGVGVECVHDNIPSS